MLSPTMRIKQKKLQVIAPTRAKRLNNMKKFKNSIAKRTSLFWILFFSQQLLIFGQNDSIKKHRKILEFNINTVEQASDFVIQERLIYNSHRKENSYCLGANIGYQIKENSYLRFSFKYTKHKANEILDERESTSYIGGDYVINNLKAEQSVYYFAPSYIWNYNFKKMFFFGGFQMVYKYYGKMSGTTKQYFYTSSNLEQTIDSRQIEDGGYSFGAGAVLGFNINFWKNLFIGAEFSSAYCYYDIGGKIRTERDILFHNNPSNNFTDYNETARTTQGHGFSAIISSINLSIKF